MKLIKMYYEIDNDLDCNCLNKCPFDKDAMVGSSYCKSCKDCIGAGEESIWLLKHKKGFYFNKGYINCRQCYITPMKFRRLMYKIKRFFQQLFKVNNVKF